MARVVLNMKIDTLRQVGGANGDVFPRPLVRHFLRQIFLFSVSQIMFFSSVSLSGKSTTKIEILLNLYYLGVALVNDC